MRLAQYLVLCSAIAHITWLVGAHDRNLPPCSTQAQVSLCLMRLAHLKDKAKVGRSGCLFVARKLGLAFSRTARATRMRC